MKYSLKIKLTISYILLSLSIVLILLFITKYIIDNKFEDYVKSNQAQNSKEIVDAINFAYEDDGTPPHNRVFRTISQTALSKGFILKVVDNNGYIIWNMQGRERNKCHSMLQNMEGNMNKVDSRFNGDYSEENYEINKDGIVYGTITLGFYGPYYYSDSDLDFINMINKTFIVCAILSLIVATIVGFYMAHKISTPIKEVIQKTKQIEHGNFKDLIDLTSNTIEVDNLIYSINNLASTLDKHTKLRKRLAEDYAHEFRTPLASLQSTLEAMIDGIWDADRERLESCNDEIIRLSRMISEIDKLVEIEKDNIVLQKTKFKVLESINKIALTFEANIAEKNITLKILGNECELYADKDKFGQIIINILSNAIKYTDYNGSININILNKTSEIEISIQDDGIGIEEEDIPYVFDYLYRTDKSRVRNTGGSGIGLAVVKSIVDAHNGKIFITSKINKGSTFTIIFSKR